MLILGPKIIEAPDGRHTHDLRKGRVSVGYEVHNPQDKVVERVIYPKMSDCHSQTRNLPERK